jgi:hypothetical protein
MMWSKSLRGCRLHRRFLPLKLAVGVLVSVFFILGLVVGPVIALADEGHDGNAVTAGVYRVTSYSNPRFPISQKEAELVVKVTRDSAPAEGLKIMLSWTKGVAVDHHGNPLSGAANGATGGMAGMAGMPTPESPVGQVVGRTMATERTPGVYVASPVFDGAGKYQVTAELNGETAHFIVAVRSGPVAWPFIMGLTAFSLLLAGVVATKKTIGREW